MGRMFYKYSIWEDVHGNMEFYSNVTTEKAAIQTIIALYDGALNRARRMWIRNNETNYIIGRVNRHKKGDGFAYAYETIDGRERYVNKDGTFVKNKKSKTNEFGLDWNMKG